MLCWGRMLDGEVANWEEARSYRFERTHLSIIELKSIDLDHSAKHATKGHSLKYSHLVRI